MNADELELLFRQHLKKVYQFYFFKVLDKASAEDLTSDTFVRFVKIASENDIAKPSSFLYGVMQNVWQEWLRNKYNREIPIESFDDFALEVETFVSFQSKKEPDEKLQRAFRVLPLHQREVLSHRFIDDLSLKETALRLGKDVNYVKVTQRRGLMALRKRLGSKE